MAKVYRKPRPGLTLLVFLLAIGAMFGIMASAGAWSPKLGLDLQGGMTITLTATTRRSTRTRSSWPRASSRNVSTDWESARPR